MKCRGFMAFTLWVGAVTALFRLFIVDNFVPARLPGRDRVAPSRWAGLVSFYYGAIVRPQRPALQKTLASYSDPVWRSLSFPYTLECTSGKVFEAQAPQTLCSLSEAKT